MYLVRWRLVIYGCRYVCVNITGAFSLGRWGTAAVRMTVSGGTHPLPERSSPKVANGSLAAAGAGAGAGIAKLFQSDALAAAAAKQTTGHCQS